MRLNYLSLALMPILLGSLLAWVSTVTVKKPLVSFHLGSIHLAHFLGLIAAVLILQLGAHLINDYYDYLHGVDTSNTFGSGELLRQGHVKPMHVLIIGLVLLGLGAVIEGIAGFGGGLYFYLFGVLALLCAYFYSATPYSLAASGLGEIVGFLVFGPLLTLSAYMVQMGPHIPPARVLIYSLPLGLLAAAVLHVNNMRDIEGDALAKKHTLATLLKLPISRIFYLLLLLATYAILIGLAIPHNAPHFILLALWTFPSFMLAVTGIMRTNAPAGFHLVLRQTLKLQRLFAILLMVGLLITACLGIVWAPALLQSLR
jgi:1,4-dihydroxy-2-naphthoate octaprenyltransferase